MPVAPLEVVVASVDGLALSCLFLIYFIYQATFGDPKIIDWWLLDLAILVPPDEAQQESLSQTKKYVPERKKKPQHEAPLYTTTTGRTVLEKSYFYDAWKNTLLAHSMSFIALSIGWFIRLFVPIHPELQFIHHLFKIGILLFVLFSTFLTHFTLIFIYATEEAPKAILTAIFGGITCFLHIGAHHQLFDRFLIQEFIDYTHFWAGYIGYTTVSFALVAIVSFFCLFMFLPAHRQVSNHVWLGEIGKYPGWTAFSSFCTFILPVVLIVIWLNPMTNFLLKYVRWKTLVYIRLGLGLAIVFGNLLLLRIRLQAHLIPKGLAELLYDKREHTGKIIAEYVHHPRSGPEQPLAGNQALFRLHGRRFFDVTFVNFGISWLSLHKP